MGKTKKKSTRAKRLRKKDKPIGGVGVNETNANLDGTIPPIEEPATNQGGI